MISKKARTWSVDRIMWAVWEDSDSGGMVLFSGLLSGMGGFVSAILQNGHAGRSIVERVDKEKGDEFGLRIWRGNDGPSSFG